MLNYYILQGVRGTVEFSVEIFLLNQVSMYGDFRKGVSRTLFFLDALYDANYYRNEASFMSPRIVKR